MAVIPTFWCDQCRTQIQIEVKHVDSFFDPEEGRNSRLYYGCCISCRQHAIVEHEVYSEADGYGAVDSYSEHALYPVAKRRLNYETPEIVRASYEEAARNLESRSYFSAVVMVRRALEAIAKDFDPGVRTAFQGIQKMLDAGAISEELSEWAHELRQLGNIGAHATDETVEPQDAVDAIDFLEAILENIYLFRPRLQELRARRRGGRQSGDQGDETQLTNPATDARTMEDASDALVDAQDVNVGPL